MERYLFQFTPEPNVNIIQRLIMRKNGNYSIYGGWRNIFHSRIRYREKLKLEGIKRLGGKCIKCGITDPRILTINHFFHKRPYRERKTGDNWIEFHMRRIDIDDIELRCFNCNILYEHEIGHRVVFNE